MQYIIKLQLKLYMIKAEKMFEHIQICMQSIPNYYDSPAYEKNLNIYFEHLNNIGRLEKQLNKIKGNLPPF